MNKLRSIVVQFVVLIQENFFLVFMVSLRVLICQLYSFLLKKKDLIQICDLCRTSNFL